ncbi:hypothetical protein B0H17DRAFT_1147323 [Mycena rosella]|uniref:Uncharacterized protein n=1 Tax=Mycena rosella TaxID=1033263 RepID=A0AAD7G2I5_MYCRO|nr:hypothetical protein B0H17DRAFT_1147323 [Mycena rosella]
MPADNCYFIAEAAEWPQYAASVNCFIRGISGHSGLPPCGYVENRVHPPTSPLPSDFPETEAAWHRRHETASIDSNEYHPIRERAAAASSGPGSDVAMSSYAFSTLVKAPEAMAKTVAEVLVAALGNRFQGKAARTKPHGLPRYGISAGTRTLMEKASSREETHWTRGRRVQRERLAAGSRWRQEAASGKHGPGGRKKHARHGKQPAGISITAVSVEGVKAEMTEVEPKREGSPLLMDGVGEDIHMDDLGG